MAEEEMDLKTQIRTVSEPILNGHLTEKVYDKNEAPVLAKRISDEIANTLHEQMRGPKYICTTYLLQKGVSSFNLSSNQIWDPQTDCSVEMKYDGNDFVCFCYVYSVAP